MRNTLLFNSVITGILMSFLITSAVGLPVDIDSSGSFSYKVDYEAVLSDDSKVLSQPFDDGIWLQYDNDIIGIPMGSGSFHPMIVANRYTPEELEPYDFWGLTEVMFYHHCETQEVWTRNVTVVIYDEGTSSSPGPIRYSEKFIVEGGGWKSLPLSTFIPIDASRDIWVSLELEIPTVYPLRDWPIVCDTGIPPHPGKSNWVQWLGDWYTQYASGRPINWLLRSKVESLLYIEDISGGLGINAEVANTGYSDVTGISWKINISGDFLIIPIQGTSRGLILGGIAAGDSRRFRAPVFGFGKTSIIVSVSSKDGRTAERTATGMIFLCYVYDISLDSE